MKRFIALISAVSLMTASVYASEITVNLDGNEIEFSGQEPVISDGRTLIPLRGVFEQLGYEISFNAETKTALFTNDGNSIEITPYSNAFVINGESVVLDVPASIINGSMLLPLRAVGEAAGLTVDWDEETKTVKLTLGEAVEEGRDLQIPAEDEEALKAAVEGMKGIFCVKSLMYLFDSNYTGMNLDDVQENTSAEDYEKIADKLSNLTESYIQVLNNLKLPEQDKILAQKLEAYIYAVNDLCSAACKYELNESEENAAEYKAAYEAQTTAYEDFYKTSDELLSNYLTEEITSKYYCFADSPEETEAANSYYSETADFLTEKLLKYIYPSSSHEYEEDGFTEDLAAVVNMLNESEPSESFLLIKYFMIGAFELFSDQIDSCLNEEYDSEDTFNFYNIKSECLMCAGSYFLDKIYSDFKN